MAPEVVALCHRAVLGNRTPTVEDLPKLKYTSMVFQEAMRLFPPVWAFEREALEDDVVAGYAVARGSLITISPYVLHRNPAFWENPEKFAVRANFECESALFVEVLPPLCFML